MAASLRNGAGAVFDFFHDGSGPDAATALYGQWGKSVQDVLKLAQPSGLEASFQNPVAGTTDFTNTELLLDVNQRAWADYQAPSERVVASVVVDAVTC